MNIVHNIIYNSIFYIITNNNSMNIKQNINNQIQLLIVNYIPNLYSQFPKQQILDNFKDLNFRQLTIDQFYNIVDTSEILQGKIITILLVKQIEPTHKLIKKLNQLNKQKLKIIIYPSAMVSGIAITCTKSDVLARVNFFKNAINLSKIGKNIKMVGAKRLNTKQGSMALRFISIRILQSKNKGFMQKMKLLNQNYKVNENVLMTKLSSINDIVISPYRKQILIVASTDFNSFYQQFKTADKNIKEYVFTILFNPSQKIQSVKNQFNLNTSNIQMIQNQIDYYIKKIPKKTLPNIKTNPSIQQYYGTLKQNTLDPKKQNSSNQKSRSSSYRIRLNSTKKIKKQFNNQVKTIQQQTIFIYQRQNQEFKRFYQSLFIKPHIIKKLPKVIPHKTFLIASYEDRKTVLANDYGSNIKALYLIFYGNQLIPDPEINHPSVHLASNNIQEIRNFLTKQNIKLLPRGVNKNFKNITSNQIQISNGNLQKVKQKNRIKVEPEQFKIVNHQIIKEQSSLKELASKLDDKKVEQIGVKLQKSNENKDNLPRYENIVIQYSKYYSSDRNLIKNWIVKKQLRRQQFLTKFDSDKLINIVQQNKSIGFNEYVNKSIKKQKQQKSIGKFDQSASQPKKLKYQFINISNQFYLNQWIVKIKKQGQFHTQKKIYNQNDDHSIISQNQIKNYKQVIQNVYQTQQINDNNIVHQQIFNDEEISHQPIQLNIYHQQKSHIQKSKQEKIHQDEDKQQIRSEKIRQLMEKQSNPHTSEVSSKNQNFQHYWKVYKNQKSDQFIAKQVYNDQQYKIDINRDKSIKIQNQPKLNQKMVSKQIQSIANIRQDYQQSKSSGTIINNTVKATKSIQFFQEVAVTSSRFILIKQQKYWIAFRKQNSQNFQLYSRAQYIQYQKRMRRAANEYNHDISQIYKRETQKKPSQESLPTQIKKQVNQNQKQKQQIKPKQQNTQNIQNIQNIQNLNQIKQDLQLSRPIQKNIMLDVAQDIFSSITIRNKKINPGYIQNTLKSYMEYQNQKQNQILNQSMPLDMSIIRSSNNFVSINNMMQSTNNHPLFRKDSIKKNLDERLIDQIVNKKVIHNKQNQINKQKQNQGITNAKIQNLLGNKLNSIIAEEPQIYTPTNTDIETQKNIQFSKKVDQKNPLLQQISDLITPKQIDSNTHNKFNKYQKKNSNKILKVYNHLQKQAKSTTSLTQPITQQFDAQNKASMIIENQKNKNQIVHLDNKETEKVFNNFFIQQNSNLQNIKNEISHQNLNIKNDPLDTLAINTTVTSSTNNIITNSIQTNTINQIQVNNYGITTNVNDRNGIHNNGGNVVKTSLNINGLSNNVNIISANNYYGHTLNPNLLNSNTHTSIQNVNYMNNVSRNNYFPIKKQDRNNQYLIGTNFKFQNKITNPQTKFIQNNSKLSQNKIKKIQIILRKMNNTIQNIANNFSQSQYKIHKYYTSKQLLTVKQKLSLQDMVILITDQIPQHIQIFRQFSYFTSIIIAKAMYKTTQNKYPKFKWITETDPVKIKEEVDQYINEFKLAGLAGGSSILLNPQRLNYNILVKQNLRSKLPFEYHIPNSVYNYFNVKNIKSLLVKQKQNIIVTDYESLQICDNLISSKDRLILFLKQQQTNKFKSQKIAFSHKNEKQIVFFIKKILQQNQSVRKQKTKIFYFCEENDLQDAIQKKFPFKFIFFKYSEYGSLLKKINEFSNDNVLIVLNINFFKHITQIQNLKRGGILNLIIYQKMYKMPSKVDIAAAKNVGQVVSQIEKIFSQ